MAEGLYLDNFEKLLAEGLRKLCEGAGLFQGDIFDAPDLDEAWTSLYIRDYIADAVSNFNEYPEVAIAWAGFLGIGAAHRWDEDWAAHKDDSYSSYYGSRGFDDMDEHILYDMLSLRKDFAKKISETLDSCAIATLGLIRHEGIETQTELGFHILARAYTVLYRIGYTIELTRLRYRKVAIDPSSIIS